MRLLIEIGLELKEAKTYDALGCKDFCRIDLMYKDGIPYVLELTPTPGIDPSYWFPRSAYAAGMTYSELLDKIINYAAKRYGIKEVK